MTKRQRLLLEAKAVEQGVTPPTQGTLDKYGLTALDWLEILDSQGWVCPICLKGKRLWNIDHEHVRNYAKLPPEERKRYVRGILCWFCNHKVVRDLRLSEVAARITAYLRAYEQRRDGE